MAAIRIERDGDVATFRMSRPPANAMNLALVEEALGVFESLAAEASPPTVVITGEGRFFSAGIDLKEVPTYSPDEQRRMIGSINRLFLGLYGYGRPVIAAVNGHALGGGLVLTLACDWRVATASAACKLGLREVRVGVPFPVGPFEIVRGELDPRAARRVALLASDLDPPQALSEGCVDELAPDDRVLARALEVARELAALPATAYAITKRDLRRGALARIAEAVETGRDPLLASWLSPETGAVAKDVLGK